MNEENKIIITDKRVDQSWKENVERDKSRAEAEVKSAGVKKSDPIFLNLLNSFIVQALVYMGLTPNPFSGKEEKNLEAARETVEMLIMLKEKTKGNLSAEEEKTLNSALTELQFKFVEMSK